MYCSDYTKPILLACKDQNGHWNYLYNFTIKNGRVIGKVWNKCNTVFIGRLTEKYKLAKFNKKYDTFKRF